MQRIFLGNEVDTVHELPDLSLREKLIFIPMVVVIIALGLFPQAVLRTSKQVMVEILKQDDDALTKAESNDQ
jgi:NADH:ubiquinone oxidoreductase subunit 4 (subunit M)